MPRVYEQAAPEPWPGGPGRGPAGRGPGHGLRPRPALRFIVKKTLTYLRRVYVSVYTSLEVFPVSSLE